ncbi:hypothetical protein [Metapseudomonas resinovorans]|uniref:hypothetical protein n=1 Tax=Metapseudomonas resinovorans TaxID=53412 RepID=UPI0003FB4A34|nr:hypothetical protein [Pseudomonas resinovorans]
MQQAKNLGRDIASADEARTMMTIGKSYANTDETLKALGWAPNRKPGQCGNLMWDEVEPETHTVGRPPHNSLSSGPGRAASRITL